ncbi:hypothetical protein Tco_0985707 [Tanacetum coccineum]
MLHRGMSGCTPIHSLLQILDFPLLSSSVKFSNIFRFIYRGSTLLVVPSLPLLLSCAKLMVVSPLSTSFEASSICVELDITRIKEMAFRNFIYTEDDEDFFPKDPSSGFGTGSPSVSINTEPLKANEDHVI